MLAVIILTGVGIGTGLYFRDNPDSFLPGNSEGYDDPNKNPSGDNANSIIPDEPNLPDDNNETTKPELPEEPETPENPEQPEFPDDTEKPTEPEVPSEPEIPEEPEVPTEPTEPVEPEEPEYSTFYIEIENEIVSLVDFLYMMTSIEMGVSVIETSVIKENEFVSYTISFIEEEMYDFEIVKGYFNDAVSIGTITIEGENFSSTYDFNDDNFSIKIDYTITV
jgi:hypothetical protein